MNVQGRARREIYPDEIAPGDAGYEQGIRVAPGEEERSLDLSGLPQMWAGKEGEGVARDGMFLMSYALARRVTPRTRGAERAAGRAPGIRHRANLVNPRTPIPAPVSLEIVTNLLPNCNPIVIVLWYNGVANAYSHAACSSGAQDSGDSVLTMHGA
jgi:hypothetical protein